MTINSFNSNTYAGFSTTINIKTTTTNSSIVKKEDDKTENPSKIYGDNWIVMQNHLIHAISDLDLNERRLVLFLSPLVRKVVDIDPNATRFIIDANKFAVEFSLNGNDYYEVVRNATFSLQDKVFWGWDFDKNDKVDYAARIGWISVAVPKYRSSLVEVELNSSVIKMLSVFDRKNPFTKYQKDLIMNLSGDGLVMLELVASFEYKRSKQESYTVEFMREKFNRVDTYENISEFKRSVLDKAIKELAKHTPYIVTCKSEANRGGREITDFVLHVSKKPDAIKVPKEQGVIAKASTKQFKKGMSDKQIAKLAIHKEQFVSSNVHMMSDRDMDFYEAFEAFKPALKNKDTVNDFNFLDEFLSSTDKDKALVLPGAPKAPKKLAAKKQPKTSSLPQALSDEDIKTIAADKHFQHDYPNKAYETGSDAHREYLEFRLKANVTEFNKKPLSLYLS